MRRKQKVVRSKLIKLELEKLTKDGRIQVPRTPAPPQSPRRSKKIIPAELIKPVAQSELERYANSTFGRGATFTLTAVVFGCVIAGLISWNDPQRWISGEAIPIALGTMAAIVALYTTMPAMARVAGLMPSETGVDWKPYFVFYRCAFFFSIPALVFTFLGPGAKVGFGLPQGGIETVTLAELELGSYKYFRASNGFVALNLTKGISETLQRAEHNPFVPRISRYRDSELVTNREAFSEFSEPTIPPGLQEAYAIAPVFEEWSSCATRYRISAGCLKKSLPVGWAIARSGSLCTSLRMVGCASQTPKLEPMYRCSTEPKSGLDEKGPIKGLCGRIIAAPRKEIIDELSALLLLDGWPESTIPNATQGWYDVFPDRCIGQTEACMASWGLYTNLSLAFIALTILCSLTPMVLDCYIDSQIREAVLFSQVSQAGTKGNAVF